MTIKNKIMLIAKILLLVFAFNFSHSELKTDEDCETVHHLHDYCTLVSATNIQVSYSFSYGKIILPLCQIINTPNLNLENVEFISLSCISISEFNPNISTIDHIELLI